MPDPSTTQPDRPRDKCGVFGVYNSPNAASDTCLGLYAQQHRGQEGAGIVTRDAAGECYIHRDLGLVSQVFGNEDVQKLRGHYGIGHVRYSTAGGTGRRDLQPLTVTHRRNLYGIAHNGNLTNAGSIKEEMEHNGSLFTTSSDTEILLHRIVRVHAESPVEKIRQGLVDVEGAFSLVMLFEEGIAAVRDPFGFRPLHVGRRDDAWFFASETCAFDIVGAEPVCEVKPGEGYFASAAGLERFNLEGTAQPHFCAFEVVYFSRPDSLHRDRTIHHRRMALGKALHDEHPVEADVVTAVPDSSNSAALGYSLASGIPLDIGLMRSHYAGRTFINPDASSRDAKVRLKFSVIRDAIAGRRVIVVDDSIVRGTTSRKIVQLLRDAGATEVHLRIASPEVSHPCYFGIDMPDRRAFLVNKVPRDVLNTYLHVDSLAFLSPESLTRVVGNDACLACFTGHYPLPVGEDSPLIAKSNAVSPESRHAHV